MSELVLLLLYGALIIFFYYLVQLFFSVYYTPGSTVLYDTPVTQLMFPNQKNRLAPTWGYDSVGRLKCDKTKYGTDNYWPEEGQGYKPTKSGSGGADPNGGERSAKVTRTEDLEIGWWNGDKEFVTHKVQDVYDHQANKIPEKTVWDVGHWSNWMFST